MSKRTSVVFKGVTYPSIYAFAKAHNVDRNTLHSFMHNHKVTAAQAMEMLKGGQKREGDVFELNKFAMMKLLKNYDF